MVTTAVLNALDADAPQSGQGWDPSSPQWAVIRAAIAWRKAVDDLDADEAVTENALIAAVDALPHIGDPEPAAGSQASEPAAPFPGPTAP